MNTPIPPPYRLGELRERVITNLMAMDDDRRLPVIAVLAVGWMIRSIGRGSITSVRSRCQRGLAARRGGTRCALRVPRRPGPLPSL